MSPATSRTAVIDAYLAAVSAGDLTAILAVYAPDATVEDPVGTEVHRGLDALRTFYARAVAVPMSAERVGSVRVAGDEAAFVFALRMPSLGREMDIIEVMTFDALDRVVAMRAFWGRENVRRVGSA